MSEAVTPPAKKRRWRKPANQITDNVNNVQERSKTLMNSYVLSRDFLHPEMLSDVDLVSRLNEHHVPVDRNCSRDELVELYSNHVMPKPQRKRKRRGQLQVNKVAEDSWATAQHNNGSLAKNHNHSSSDRKSTVNQVVITKRKQSDDPSPPHRKKAFIRNDITWP